MIPGANAVDLPARNTETYFRSSLGLLNEISSLLYEDFHSRVVEHMRNSGFTLRVGAYEFRLSQKFGFCYGVEKAVDMAYEAREKFPERRIFLTHEIIHNPRVNSRLHEMGILFLGQNPENPEALDEIQPSDVVILPAFGVATDLLQKLLDRGCILVDTTCGSVMHVWKRVERFAREGFTSLIHGKHAHEETMATKSRAIANGGHYIIVRDLQETDLVCDAIRGRVPRERLHPLLEAAASPGFDPERHLERIGCANQTTMLSSESIEVAQRMRQALIDRWGEEHIDEHFRAFDTICSATQDRQDAAIELARQGLDLMIVVGGFNSSNTSHLCEIAGAYCPAYHIDDATAILSAEEIRHKPVHSKDAIITRGWLDPKGGVIGITAGASTPNRAIGQTIRRVLEVRGLSLPESLDEPSARINSGQARTPRPDADAK